MIKKNRFMKKIIIFAFIGGLLFTGCDEFLERDLTDQYSVSSVFQTETDIRFALNALYRQVRGMNTNGNPDQSEYLYSLLTDDGFDRVGTARGSTLIFTESEQVVSEEYRSRYTFIRDVNEFLDRAPQAEPAIESDLYARYIAEARFLRVLQYARLHFIFKDIVLHTEPTPPDFFPFRMNRETVFNWINDEFDAIAAILPESYAQENVGRITSGTVLAFKARHNLNAIDWHSNPTELHQNAFDACEAIVNSGVYSLDAGVEGFQSLFNRDTSFGLNTSEAMWTINYDRELKTHGYANATLPKGAFSGSKRNNSAYAGFDSRIVEAYQMQANGLDVHDGLSGYDPADPWTGRDPRLDITVLRSGEIIPAKGGDGVNDLYVFDPHPSKNPKITLPNGTEVKSVKTDDVNKNAINKTGYYFQKYMDFDWDHPTNNGNIHYHFIRYAEVLLMYAEAALAIGNTTIAESMVDEVRSRVNMPNVVTSYGRPVDIDIIIKERRLEFAGEGPQRWFDIRRHRLGAQVFADPNVYGIPLGPKRKANKNVDDGDLDSSLKIIVGERFFNPDNYYVWPIPQGAIVNNPNLLEQPE